MFNFIRYQNSNSIFIMFLVVLHSNNGKVFNDSVPDDILSPDQVSRFEHVVRSLLFTEKIIRSGKVSEQFIEFMRTDGRITENEILALEKSEKLKNYLDDRNGLHQDEDFKRKLRDFIKTVNLNDFEIPVRILNAVESIVNYEGIIEDADFVCIEFIVVLPYGLEAMEHLMNKGGLKMVPQLIERVFELLKNIVNIDYETMQEIKFSRNDTKFIQKLKLLELDSKDIQKLGLYSLMIMNWYRFEKVADKCSQILKDPEAFSRVIQELNRNEENTESSLEEIYIDPFEFESLEHVREILNDRPFFEKFLNFSGMLLEIRNQVDFTQGGMRIPQSETLIQIEAKNPFWPDFIVPRIEIAEYQWKNWREIQMLNQMFEAKKFSKFYDDVVGLVNILKGSTKFESFAMIAVKLVDLHSFKVQHYFDNTDTLASAAKTVKNNTLNYWAVHNEAVGQMREYLGNVNVDLEMMEIIETCSSSLMKIVETARKSWRVSRSTVKKLKDVFENEEKILKFDKLEGNWSFPLESKDVDVFKKWNIGYNRSNSNLDPEEVLKGLYSLENFEKFYDDLRAGVKALISDRTFENWELFREFQSYMSNAMSFDSSSKAVDYISAMLSYNYPVEYKELKKAAELDQWMNKASRIQKIFEENKLNHGNDTRNLTKGEMNDEDALRYLSSQNVKKLSEVELIFKELYEITQATIDRVHMEKVGNMKTITGVSELLRRNETIVKSDLNKYSQIGVITIGSVCFLAMLIIIGYVVFRWSAQSQDTNSQAEVFSDES